jgi:D-lactate dehydrogenase (cytochrome)
MVRSPSFEYCLSNFISSEEDSDLVCQPGVGWMEINQTLKEKGIPLFFPVRAKRCFTVLNPTAFLSQLDPGPTATIGGMLSTGCSGSQYHHDCLLGRN